MSKKNINKKSGTRKKVITNTKTKKTENKVIKKEAKLKIDEKLLLTKKATRKKDLINFLIIFGLSLVYFLEILDKDVIFDAHDLIFHTSNVITIAEDLSLTNLIPSRILPTLVNNLGYGVNIFYPNFPHIVGSYLYKLIGNIPLTFKLLSLIIINLSGITMYKLIDKIFKNKNQALLSALTYISMPYFFSEFFIRCALNESFLFFIIPIILLGIHYLIDDNNKFMFYLLFVIGYVLAINSHLVMSVYLTVILIIYLLVQRKKVFKKDVIINFSIASIFILLLTANFTVPLLEHNHLGIYYILNIDYSNQLMVEVTNTFNYLLPIKHLDMPMYIPPLISGVLIYIFTKMYQINKEHKTILLGMYIILVFSIFLATNQTIWNYLPNIIRNIQFGWRMSLFIVITVSILFGYIINLLNKDLRKPFIILFILIYITTNFINTQLIEKQTLEKDEYLVTTEEKQWGKEYLPLESINNLPEIKVRKQEIVTNNQKAKVEITKNKTPNLNFTIKNIDKETKLEFPRIYYLGYRLTDEKGKEYKLNRSFSGLIETTINKDGKYKLEYTGTSLDQIAFIISPVFYIIFLLYLSILKYNKKRGVRNADK